MVEMLQASGVSGPLLVVIVAAVLAWGAVKAVLKAWTTLLATMQRLVTNGIDSHVRQHHSSDAAFRDEIREALRQIRVDIRGVHARIDDHLHAEAEAGRRRAVGDDEG